jgi:muconolactone delta-isomerase
MRFAVIVRLTSAIPPEQFPGIVERFAEWREEYKDRTEVFEFFVGGAGGLMIVDMPDEVELSRMMAEYPFTPYVEMDLRPIIDGDTGLSQWWQVMRRVLGDQQ